MTIPKRRSPVPLCLMILVLVAVVGCQTDTEGEGNFESGEFAILDYEDVMDSVTSATIEEPIEIDSTLCSGDCLREGRRFGRGGPRGPMGPRLRRIGTGNHLGRILTKLHFTEDQRAQLHELMSAHRECVKEPLNTICETSRELIKDANEQRKVILATLKEGEVDREEAREQLRELSESTREAIRDNPENEEALEALCACKLDLFENIRSILHEEQQLLWDEWVSGLEGPCIVEN